MKKLLSLALSAALRYLPAPIHQFYVDAQTGETVDLTALGQGLWEGDRGTLGHPPARL